MQGLSVKEVASRLTIAVSTFYLMVGKGTAPPITKIGNRSIVFERDLEVWIAKQPKK